MENLRGILLMIASMAGFAFEDMFVKLASASLPTGQILVMMGLVGTSIFAALAARQGKNPISPELFARAVVWRNLGEVVGTLGFITAISLAPLSTASAILQATPLAVTLGAALVLGETVGWRRWSAIVVGFTGVMMVVRPGMEGFQPASLWAVLAVIGMSVRDLATRRVPPTISTMQLAAWGFLAVTILGAGMMLALGGNVVPGIAELSLIGGALSFGVAAYWAVIAAMRLGEISVIAPFRYTRLVFALILGTSVFGERPDLWTLSGAMLIIGSGLYSVARERIRARRTLARAALAG
jgi:drug/metabolite transporter (DMT)-like permease